MDNNWKDYGIEARDRNDIAAVLDLKNAILQTLVYADVFDYPLTAAEIHRYMAGIRASRYEVEKALQEGLWVHTGGGFYTLPARETLVNIRLKREQTAKQMWPLAILYGSRIAHLPYVRMVAVTGSLAMNNVGQNSDIDYFIVTAPGRLWMVRALVLAITRWAWVRGVRLCPNYLVTEDALDLADQTLYAAHELAQMVPLFGLDLYELICQANPWKDIFLPNAQGLPPVMDHVAIQVDHTVLKEILENALRMPPGAWFEHWEMQRKISQLSREQGNSPESGFSADYCKGHSLQHGQHTERSFRERLEGLRLEVRV